MAAVSMTSSQIKKKAFELLKENPEKVITSSFSILSMYSFVILIETLVFIAAQLLGYDYSPFSLSYYKESWLRTAFLLMRVAFYYVIIFSQIYKLRRTFISISDKSADVDVFVSGHKRRVIVPSLLKSFALIGLKLLVLTPISIGIFGIVHYYNIGMTSDISIPQLVLFMLSIGFTIVWAGVCSHYYLSLSLVKYICELNPRANFFDACDLSVKLMDGRHQRVLVFYASVVLLMLPAVLIYPLVVLYPFMLECRLLLAREIMGVHWQDKLPAMSRRWEKQQNRMMK